MNRQLDIMDFKNRPWLFAIIAPIIFIIFILTFAISSLFDVGNQKTFFFLTFVFFMFEIRIITILFSKFRYISNGHLIFNEEGIYTYKSRDTFNIKWEDIKELKFYYRGDRKWRLKIGKCNINYGWYRYNNLHWYILKNLDEQILDKVNIDGRIKYVKIRNKNDKMTFYELVSLSNQKGCNNKIIETEITYNLFGRKFKA
jgi:hypothetical protein